MHSPYVATLTVVGMQCIAAAIVLHDWVGEVFNAIRAIF